MCQMKMQITPVVIGALGVIKKVSEKFTDTRVIICTVRICNALG